MAEYPYERIFTGPAPTAAQLEAAKPYRVTSYSVVWDYGPTKYPYTNTSQQLIDSAKAWLASGHVLDVGIKASFADFPDRNGENHTHYFDPTYTVGELGVGHQVVFCGYDDNINPSGAGPDHQGGFLMVNEAGTNWNGDMHGYLWVSYAFVKQYVCDCSVITGVVSDTPLVYGCDTNVGKVGDVITITGDSFGTYRRASKVTFNGVPATNMSFSNTVATVTVPVGATSGPLVVYNWEGTPSKAFEFKIVPPPPTLKIAMQDGSILLQATGTAGQSLLFSTSTNLFNWVPWVRLPNPSGTVRVLDPAPPVPRKFYRAEQP